MVTHRSAPHQRVSAQVTEREQLAGEIAWGDPPIERDRAPRVPCERERPLGCLGSAAQWISTLRKAWISTLFTAWISTLLLRTRG